MQGVPTTLRDVVEGTLNHLKRKAAGLPVDGGCICEWETTPINKRGSQRGEEEGTGLDGETNVTAPPSPSPSSLCSLQGSYVRTA